MIKILLFSALRKSPSIVELFLNSIGNLARSGFSLNYLLYDDNTDELSKVQVSDFVESHDNAELLERIDFREDSFEGEHKWNAKQIDKITIIKNTALKYASSNGYDYVFLVDGDIVMNTQLLSHLLSLKKSIVAEVFWTKFWGESYHKPNAWDYHSWAYSSAESILKYKEQGVYEVGATGACTLLDIRAYRRGLDFSRIPNLPYPGEDRHFSTRAQALGYKLFLDTSFPAYHIFDEIQVTECRHWYEQGGARCFFDEWLDSGWKGNVQKSFRAPPETLLGKLHLFQHRARREWRLIFREQK